MVFAILSGHLLEKICKHNQAITDSATKSRSDDLWQEYQQLRHELEVMMRKIPPSLQATKTLDTLALHVSISLYSFSISLDQNALDFMHERLQSTTVKQIRERQRHAANAIPRIVDIALQKGVEINRVRIVH